MKLRLATAGATAALLLATAGLSAQNAEQNPSQLEAEAASYLDNMDKWGKAADLYRQAAALREAGDDTAISNLKTAARLEFYQGSERQAVRDLETAAQRAIAIGDVLAAANAFADAAWVAGNEGDGALARELVERAHLLALSPLISPSDRSAIESRLPAAGQ